MLAAFEKHGVDATRRRLSRNFFFGDFDGTLLDEVVAHAARTPEHVFVREIEGMCEWNGAETARRCLLPVLHVAATFPTCSHAALAEAIPDAVLGQAVGTGHYVQLEVPDQVNAMIEQFLRRYVA